MRWSAEGMAGPSGCLRSAKVNGGVDAAVVNTLMRETRSSGDTLSSRVTPTRVSSILRRLIPAATAAECNASEPPTTDDTFNVTVSKKVLFSGV